MSGRQCLRFSVVGAIGIGVQLTVLLLLTRGLGLNYLLATALAVESAVLHNFLWHQRYTWPEREVPGVRARLARLARFHLSAGAISLAGNLLCMRLLVTGAHLPVPAANLISITACWAANYLASDRWVFRVPPRRDRAWITGW